ncbi:carotenoid oxygenase family protein [Streptomyces sp. SID8499]|uniref:carotenoid oxygenase family protein n=1 Tax=Streptomyces sp. SID8499 TaxID=2706106 RepID=UPI0013CB9B52|nr:carotenoid oxygenase family protein [Streptomyces sp. SID8499]NED38292.1 carotenoid oxygenase family protein [Streptomyces sp. SID8499]
MTASTAFDPARTAHLSGRFAPVTEEVDVAELETTGELPPDLDGVYLRNGPNPRFTPIGSYLYPIDGDGMIHGVWLSEGRARYRNRFVRTPAMIAEERAGRALWGGLESMITPGPEEVGDALAHTFKPLPDINVVRHAGRLLALAESDCPFRMSPDLDTLGKETFDGRLPAGITAHPKIDPATGELAVFCYALEPPYLTWSSIGPDGTVRSGPAPVAGAEEPQMIHDMALTARYLVLVLAPAFFDVTAALNGGSFIAWRPDRGTRIALIPRDGGPVRWADDEAFWLWHTVNAYDDPGSGQVVLDYVQWPALSLGAGGPADGRGGHPGRSGGGGRSGDGSRAGDGGRSGGSGRHGLTRALIDPVAGTVRRTVLDDSRVELPRIDDRFLARPHHRLAVASDSGRVDGLLPGEYDALRWYDLGASGVTSQVWNAGDLSVGEPVFAPAPGTRDGERGYWLTYATDRTDGASWFLVLPADDPAQGPVARARIPVRVPLGLHGVWLPTEE